jgi:uncharacterized protein YjbJ (UPF0337 family)
LAKQFFVLKKLNHASVRRKTIMNWDHIENNWDDFKGKIKQNWTEISDQQLEMVAGKRDRFARVIQRTYHIGPSEAELQLSDWQNSQINIDGHFYAKPPLLHKHF